MKLIIIVITIILSSSLFSCCEKNPLDPESDNTYTIEGVMYDQDGVSPLKNYPLNIVADKGQTIGGGSDYDYPDQTTTDDNGYFKMTYRGNSSYSSLWIGQPSSITPVYGPFLTGIPANQNIERDICILPFSIVQIKLNLNMPLSNQDTVFIFHDLTKPLNDSVFSFQLEDQSKAPVSVLIYTANSKIANTTWNFNFKWTTQYGGEAGIIRWGLGRENFNLAANMFGYERSNSSYYDVKGYRLLLFPDTTKISININ